MIPCWFIMHEEALKHFHILYVANMPYLILFMMLTSYEMLFGFPLHQVLYAVSCIKFIMLFCVFYVASCIKFLYCFALICVYFLPFVLTLFHEDLCWLLVEMAIEFCCTCILLCCFMLIYVGSFTLVFVVPYMILSC